MIIRTEIETDYPQVDSVIKQAFAEMEISDQTEHLLVKRLRKSKNFIPDLSLVALINDRVVGHILLTTITIITDQGHEVGLALAPVSVLPSYHNKGIGSALIIEAHKVAEKLGYEFIVLVGHENYYPRFGYEEAAMYGIKYPFEVSAINSMVLFLNPAHKRQLNGTVQYAKEFFG